MAKDCLYCGLQFSETTHFCPNCGRPTESGFSIRPIQGVELERFRGEMQAGDGSGGSCRDGPTTARTRSLRGTRSSASTVFCVLQ
jgi:hypothetical protein